MEPAEAELLSAGAEPEEAAEPESAGAEPEEAAEPESAGAEPEEAAEPESAGAEPEEAAEPESAGVEPQEAAEPESAGAEPEEAAEPVEPDEAELAEDVSAGALLPDDESWAQTLHVALDTAIAKDMAVKALCIRVLGVFCLHLY